MTAATEPPPLQVAIYDDVVAARGEQFRIPGLSVTVFAHADDAVAQCRTGSFDVVFMDFSLGPDRKSGDVVTHALRASGYRGQVVAISSDPAANAAIRAAGADRALATKAHLRSYLVHLGATHLGAAPVGSPSGR
jgi:DNA-binding NarL/FixJ family response regulator